MVYPPLDVAAGDGTVEEGASAADSGSLHSGILPPSSTLTGTLPR